jgi:hypothetical protein
MTTTSILSHFKVHHSYKTSLYIYLRYNNYVYSMTSLMYFYTEKKKSELSRVLLVDRKKEAVKKYYF